MIICQQLPQLINIYHQYQQQITLSQFFQVLGLYELFVNKRAYVAYEAFIWSYIFQFLESHQTSIQQTSIQQTSIHKTSIHKTSIHQTHIQQTQQIKQTPLDYLGFISRLKLSYYQYSLKHQANEWYFAWWGYQILKEYNYQYQPRLTLFLDIH